MSAIFFGVTNRFFSYHDVIGRTEYVGKGMKDPVDVALGADDVMYVVSRSSEYRLDGIRITKVTFSSDYLVDFGEYGEGDGQFVWPTSIALDGEGNVYIADEWLNRILVFTKDGKFIHQWGKAGSGDGELDRPAGLVITGDGTMFLTDARNHRVQKFTLDGQYLGQFGSFGSGPGELNMPWGINLDKEGLVYVADWRNDRIQQFSPDGKYQATFGQSGSGVGQFNRPTGVCVDQDGDIYVADWLNNRVQVLTPEGRFITAFTGDAGLSKEGRQRLESSVQMVQQRSLVRDMTPEQKFRYPRAVKVDEQGRIVVVDTGLNRVQIYKKDKTPVLV